MDLVLTCGSIDEFEFNFSLVLKKCEKIGYWNNQISPKNQTNYDKSQNSSSSSSSSTIPALATPTPAPATSSHCHTSSTRASSSSSSPTTPRPGSPSSAASLSPTPPTPGFDDTAGIGLSRREGHWRTRGGCIGELHKIWGRMPLKYSYGKVSKGVGEKALYVRGGRLLPCDA